MAMLARRASSSTADRAARISWYFCLNITFSLLEKSVQFMFIIVSYSILFKHRCYKPTLRAGKTPAAETTAAGERTKGKSQVWKDDLACGILKKTESLKGLKYMYIAVDENGNRIDAFDADKGNSYFCPVCGGPVILRAGLVNTRHFAHVVDGKCDDSWTYDMSEWHRRMQSFFPAENREVIVKHDGKIHRADVLVGNIAIEMQHSQISAEEFNDRNKFFESAGYRLVWVFDVRDKREADNIQHLNEDTISKFRWNHPMRIFDSLDKPLSDYDKNYAIYLHLYDAEDGRTDIYRVVWTKGNNDGWVDFSRFAISEEPIVMEELEDIEEFFIPLACVRRERVKAAIRKLTAKAKKYGFRYSVKYIGEKGKPRNAYICERRNRFGLRWSGETACCYCKYCAMMVTNKRGDIRKAAVYCCYPRTYRVPDERTHPGYECFPVSQYDI